MIRRAPQNIHSTWMFRVIERNLRAERTASWESHKSWVSASSFLVNLNAKVKSERIMYPQSQEDHVSTITSYKWQESIANAQDQGRVLRDGSREGSQKGPLIVKRGKENSGLASFLTLPPPPPPFINDSDGLSLISCFRYPKLSALLFSRRLIDFQTSKNVSSKTY